LAWPLDNTGGQAFVHVPLRARDLRERTQWQALSLRHSPHSAWPLGEPEERAEEQCGLRGSRQGTGRRAAGSRGCSPSSSRGLCLGLSFIAHVIGRGLPGRGRLRRPAGRSRLALAGRVPQCAAGCSVAPSRLELWRSCACCDALARLALRECGRGSVTGQSVTLTQGQTSHSESISQSQTQSQGKSK
jgi:hypothetical protein